MCKGVYQRGPLCRLFVEGIVGIGSPAPTGARTIRFLVDTGATSTLISAADAVRLGILYDSKGHPRLSNALLPTAGRASGVGGTLGIYRLKKVFLTIVSSEPNWRERHTEYVKELLVAGLDYQDESLIGMDLLQRFKFLIDSQNSLVDFTRIPVRGTSYLVQHP